LRRGWPLAKTPSGHETLEEICKKAGCGDKTAQKAKKLLNDCRFKKALKK
jgi:hypothetical protein